MSRMYDVKIFCKEYMRIYNFNIMPAIKKKRNATSMAYIKSEECYNDKFYCIYLNKKYKNYTIGMIKAIIFHEMTHISDTVTFQNLSYKDFIMTMSTYSEIHAAEIELEARMLSGKDPITIQSLVWDSDGFISIEDLIKNRIMQFKKLYYYNSFENFLYVLGYVRTLKKYNIDYEQELLNLLPEFEFVYKYIKSIIQSKTLDRKVALDMFNILQDYRKQGKVIITN